MTVPYEEAGDLPDGGLMPPIPAVPSGDTAMTARAAGSPDDRSAQMSETRKGKTLLPGHGLMYEGRAQYGKRGRCWCGATSDEEYETAAARRRWHNAHKGEIRAVSEPSR